MNFYITVNVPISYAQSNSTEYFYSIPLQTPPNESQPYYGFIFYLPSTFPEISLTWYMDANIPSYYYGDFSMVVFSLGNNESLSSPSQIYSITYNTLNNGINSYTITIDMPNEFELSQGYYLVVMDDLTNISNSIQILGFNPQNPFVSMNYIDDGIFTQYYIGGSQASYFIESQDLNTSFIPYYSVTGANAIPLNVYINENGLPSNINYEVQIVDEYGNTQNQCITY